MVNSVPDVETLLGGLGAEQFLNDYWQKRPLRIIQAWPNVRTPLSVEELAGLSCEEGVESRLVTFNNNQWSVRNGPHSEASFTSLSDSNWTLLVPDCEKYLPELQQFIDPFRFIPNWRIDDLMISYATDGGGVGPHLDEYDVFLLQLEGTRHWQINPQLADASLRDDCELAILENFSATESWTLEAGDMLYLPPGVAHDGVAMGNCFTASIGFRAPLANNLAMDFASHLAQQAPLRYTDQNLSPTKQAAELRDTDLIALADSIQQVFTNQSELPQWAGEFLTTSSSSSSEHANTISKDAFKLALAEKTALTKSPWSKLLYYRGATELTLFADAVSFPIGIDYLSVIQTICNTKKISFEQSHLNDKEVLNLLYDLYLQGTLLLDT